MDPSRPDRIVIRAEDLADPKVDEALSRIESFGMAPPAEKVEEKKSGLLYKGWFVLMVGGGLGAFLAWLLIEPFFSDGLVLEGNVETFSAQGESILAPGLRGHLRVSGNDVWLLEKGTSVYAGGKRAEDPAAALARARVVRVQGQPFGSGEQGLLALRIEVLPDTGRRYPRQDLGSLAWRDLFAALLVFPLVSAFGGMLIGCADGFLSRAYHRAVVCGAVGLGLGLGVGLVASFVSEIVYMITNAIVEGVNTRETGFSLPAFLAQMMSRGIAWALAGVAMGMGQGVALRSRKLLANGLLGGAAGGLLGGMLFDPIDYLVHGNEFAGAELSRCVGFTIIGLATGLLIGIVELLAREAWLKMLTGPIAGKEFVLYRNPIAIGSSPKSDVYLFKDPAVEPRHALVHRMGEGYEIEDQKTGSGTFLNGAAVRRRRLHDSDQIRIGQTVMAIHIKDE